MSTANIEEARELLEARARELRDELTRIEQAISSLGNSSAAPQTRARPRGRRAQQALELIVQHPGITIRRLATMMGLKGPHYLYRVLPRLEEDRLIEKHGEGYRAAKA